MSNLLLEYNTNPLGWESVILTINRPKQLNSLNLETIAEIDETLDLLIQKKNIRSLIITGAGDKAFVAGADIKQLEHLDASGAQELSRKGNKAFSKLASLPFPVIAAVNGFALGGGLELALACDIRLAAKNASFSLPEAALGVCPGWGGTQRLARVVGIGHAAEMMFSGSRIDAVKGLEIGLVNAVYPQEELLDIAKELANKIGKNGPLAVGAIKRAMYLGHQTSLQEGLEIEGYEFSLLFNTKDAKAGLKAFSNKEKYEYTGE